jgi:hypothetical protein
MGTTSKMLIDGKIKLKSNVATNCFVEDGINSQMGVSSLQTSSSSPQGKQIRFSIT